MGQIAIENDHVVVVEQCLLHAGGPVVRDIRPEPAITQSLADVVGQLDLVLHDEHPHRTILPQAPSHRGHGAAMASRLELGQRAEWVHLRHAA